MEQEVTGSIRKSLSVNSEGSFECQVLCWPLGNKERMIYSLSKVFTIWCSWHLNIVVWLFSRFVGSDLGPFYHCQLKSQGAGEQTTQHVGVGRSLIGEGRGVVRGGENSWNWKLVGMTIWDPSATVQIFICKALSLACSWLCLMLPPASLVKDPRFYY